jgi:hypothetical protein
MVEVRMTEHHARSVLGFLLVIERVLVVKPEDNSSIDNDMQIFFQIKNNVILLALNHTQVHNDLSKMVDTRSVFNESAEQRQVAEEKHCLVNISPSSRFMVQNLVEWLVQMLVPEMLRVIHLSFF